MALYIPVNVPVIDPRTGLMSTIWQAYFRSLTALAGDIPAASGTVAALTGTGSAGVATTYSRGDHTHGDANRPSNGEKAALVGTDGTPGAGNPYVTDSDPRLDGAPDSATFVTVSDETATLTSSRQIVAGSNITLDTTTPGQLSIAASVGAGSVEAVTFAISGGGSVISTGLKAWVQVPFDGTITRAVMLADQTGSAVVDVWKDTYANFPPTNADSITASAPPTLSAAISSEDATLTGWSTSITEGDVLAFNVDSATTITALTLELWVQRT